MSLAPTVVQLGAAAEICGADEKASPPGCINQTLTPFVASFCRIRSGVPSPFRSAAALTRQLAAAVKTIGAVPIAVPSPVMNQMLTALVVACWKIRSVMPSAFISAAAQSLQPGAAVANHGADTMAAPFVPPIDQTLTPLLPWFCKYSLDPEGGGTCCTGMMFVRSVAVAETEPPPDTVTWFVSCAATSGATDTTTVRGGYAPPAASESSRENVVPPHVHPVPFIDVTVRPIGGLSTTDTVPAVGPLPC